MWILIYDHNTQEMGHEQTIARSIASYEINVIHIVQIISLFTLIS